MSNQASTSTTQGETFVPYYIGEMDKKLKDLRENKGVTGVRFYTRESSAEDIAFAFLTMEKMYDEGKYETVISAEP